MKPLNMTERGTLSHNASILLAATTEDKRNQALQAIASALRSQQDFIIEVNQKDLEMAKANKLDAPLLKRLRFDTNKIEDGFVSKMPPVCVSLMTLLSFFLSYTVLVV